MRRTRFDEWPCPIARTTDLIGDWWTPLVLREAFAGVRRFDDFIDATSASRAPCSRRGSIVSSTRGCSTACAYEERPPRYEYRLTDKGRAFWDVLAAMWRWGEDWLWPDGERPPVRLVDRETGEEIHPVVVDEHTGTRLDIRRTKIRRR